MNYSLLFVVHMPVFRLFGPSTKLKKKININKIYLMEYLFSILIDFVENTLIEIQIATFVIMYNIIDTGI